MTIVHLIKSSVVESFVSYQLELLDIIQTGTSSVHRDEEGGLGQTLASNRYALELDPYLASKYVRAIESNRDDYRHLIKHGTVGTRLWSTRAFSLALVFVPRVLCQTNCCDPSWTGHIKYFEVFNEDLDSKFSKSYLGALQRFLGVAEKDLLSFKEVLHRIHQRSCQDKIANWADVKEHLKGTDSYYSCRKGWTILKIIYKILKFISYHM